jgi:small conductance mechanosensitive channel
MSWSVPAASMLLRPPTHLWAQTTTTVAPATASASATGTPAGLKEACGTSPSWTCQAAYDRTASVEWTKAIEWFIAKPLTILLIVLVAFVANRIARRLIRRSFERLVDPENVAKRALRRATPNVLMKTAEFSPRTEARAQTLTTVFRSLATVFIWIVAGIAILGVLQVNVTALLASAGLIGVALGFGAQNIVRDFLAGTFMVIEDQFGVGDIVDLGGEVKGTVESFTLRATHVRDVNGTLWHIPNGQVTRVANKSQEWARALLDLEVDTATDYDQVAALIQEVADTLASEENWMADVLATPEVWGIETFTAEGYTVRLVVKTRPASQFGVMRELRIRLKAAFDEAGIELAGAHPELWVHAGEPDAAIEGAGASKGSTRPVASGPTEHPTRGDPSEAG